MQSRHHLLKLVIINLCSEFLIDSIYQIIIRLILLETGNEVFHKIIFLGFVRQRKQIDNLCLRVIVGQLFIFSWFSTSVIVSLISCRFSICSAEMFACIDCLNLSVSISILPLKTDTTAAIGITTIMIMPITIPPNEKSQLCITHCYD